MAYIPTDEQVKAAIAAQSSEDTYVMACRSYAKSPASKPTGTHDLYMHYSRMTASLFEKCSYAPEQVKAARLAALQPAPELTAVEKAAQFPLLPRTILPLNADGVLSSNVNSAGWCSPEEYLDVEFNGSGSVYRYVGVPQHIYEEWLRSESKGSFFGFHIKHKYPTLKRVGDAWKAL